MAVKPPYIYTPSLPSLHAWLWLVGPFTGVRQSAVRRWTTGRGILTLHVACDTDITVTVQTRRVAHWRTVLTLTGRGMGARIKTPDGGQDIRVLVAGEADGLVEVVVR